MPSRERGLDGTEARLEVFRRKSQYRTKRKETKENAERTIKNHEK